MDYSRRESQGTGTDDLIYHGERHSAGGHTVNDGTSIASPPFAPIMSADERSITVGASSTWESILRRGYVPRSMQAYYNLSVGGSISVNAHGAWWNCLPTGQIVTELQTEHGNLTPDDELFWHYVGGYGLVGRINCATVQIESDCRLIEQSILLPADQIQTADMECHRWAAHLSSDWRSIYARVGFRGEDVKVEWKPPKFWIENLVFNLPFSARWAIQKAVDAVDKRPLLSQKLAHTEWFEPHLTKPWRYSYLMEYFLPKDRAAYWMEEVRERSLQPTGMMNTSIRQVRRDPRPIMSYAPDSDAFSFVIYGRTGRNESRLKEETELLIDSVLNYGGTYYLPYRPHATREQFARAYPRWRELKVKPGLRSRFSERYLTSES